MYKTIISCDTTCAIYGKEREDLGIYVIPLNVIVNGEEKLDGISINHEQLCKDMRGGAKISTSTPSPVEIENYFDKILKENPDVDKIIHFTISSKLSSMYSLFKTTCEEKYGDKIIVFDTLAVCSFMGNIVKYAVKLNKEGKSPEEIIKGVQSRMGQSEIYFIPKSLEFLKRGGRVSPAVAAIGNLLGIKPVLKFTEETGVDKEATTRTTKKAYLNALEKFSHRPNLENYELHLIEFDSMKLCKEIEEAAKEFLPNMPVKITPMSINVCAHAGPGTVGLGICLKV